MLAEEISDWVNVVRRQIVRVPFFAGAEFDHDPLDRPLVMEQSSLTYDEVVFFRPAEGKSPVTFGELIKKIAWQIHQRGERLPAQVTVPFDPPWQVLFPGQQPLTVRGVKLWFEPHLLRMEHKIACPHVSRSTFTRMSLGQTAVKCRPTRCQ
ncbi:MAG: hypothetical protein WCF57_17885 [Pyrinomonadaceae bacterium]